MPIKRGPCGSTWSLTASRLKGGSWMVAAVARLGMAGMVSAEARVAASIRRTPSLSGSRPGIRTLAGGTLAGAVPLLFVDLRIESYRLADHQDAPGKNDLMLIGVGQREADEADSIPSIMSSRSFWERACHSRARRSMSMSRGRRSRLRWRISESSASRSMVWSKVFVGEGVAGDLASVHLVRCRGDGRRSVRSYRRGVRGRGRGRGRWRTCGSP